MGSSGLTPLVTVPVVALVLAACGPPPAGESRKPAAPQAVPETPAAAPQAVPATPAAAPQAVPATPAPAANALLPPPAGEPFVDRTAETGLDFVHFNGMSGAFYIPENMNSGGALLDYDNDGDLDLYLVQGRMLGEGKTTREAIFAPHHPEPLTDRLYRNELEDGVLRFTDVTAAAGLGPDGGYGSGVAAGDYDADGRVDLYVTAFGSNRLLRNLGDGSFADLTAQAGVDDPRWSVPAVFFDYDRDGWLDLYVGNYVDFTYANHRPCTTRAGALDYCSPAVFEGVHDRLFHNRGDGTFADVTTAAGLTEATPSRALGVVAVDLDGDDWLDLYVTNDRTANHLWLNQRDGTFREEALYAGCALNRDGQGEASMGIDAGDYDLDGDFDLFMAHLTGETHTLYRNDGGLFEDVTAAAGLSAASLEATGFGTRFLDYDHDGLLDLLVVNGTVLQVEAQAQAREPYPFRQPNQLFRGVGQGRFEDVSTRSGVFAQSEVSRGALFGDLDNDGDTDVVVVNNAGPARVWINAVGQDRPWLGVRLLLAGEPVREALGARVALVRSGRPPLWRRVGTDGSYSGANDPRVVFGLGAAATSGTLRIVWPDGSGEERAEMPVGRYTNVIRGQAHPERPGSSSEGVGR